MDPFAPGTDLGKYRVVRPLAAGGMAEIYLAQTHGYGRFVVLKRIRPEYAADEAHLKTFVNEALDTAGLDHPNIASVHDVGAVDGSFIFTREYLNGQNLAELLAELETRKVRLPLEHALTIAAGVAAGLHAAHEKKGADGKPLGILHQDVSPSNVMVTFQGYVKLVDFGLASLAAAVEGQEKKLPVRKVPYRSPEQAQGLPLDRRSDVFALGTLLYELTTQTRLYPAGSEEELKALWADQPLPPPTARVKDFPSELEPVLARALHQDREQRFENALEVQHAVEQVAQTRNLTLSAVQLGQWLTATLGAKNAAGERGTTPGERAAVPQTLQDVDESTGAIVRPTRAARERRRLAVGAALVLTAGATFALLAIRFSRPGARPQPPGAERAAEPPGPAAPGAPPENQAGTEREARREPTRPAGRRPAGGEVAPARASSFSAVFARKESEVLRCFARFTPPGQPAPQIAVRFRVDTDGAVMSAEVLPPDVAQTGLGICVADVAMDTHFEPQLTPVVVRIPVSVRLGNNRSRGLRAGP